MILLRALPVFLFCLFASGAARAADAPVPPPAPPKPGAACALGHFRDFDFWVGEWDVYGPQGQKVGTSQITKILGDCVIAEHWVGGGGVEGRSHNMYAASHDRWTQFWVDNTGNSLILHGGLQGDAMVLVGDQPNAQTGKNDRQRITWSRLPNGIVRQLWDTSSDGGTTWTVAFDGRYQPAGSAPPALIKDAAKS